MAEINNVIAEASQDLQTIEDFVNLPAGSDVRPRLLPSVNVGTLAGTRQAIFEAGGLPATPFATKALMTASSLDDGDYAMVTDDTANNGLYVKEAGAWAKSDYDPYKQTVAYVDSNALFKPSTIEENTDVDNLASGYFFIPSDAIADSVANIPWTTLRQGYIYSLRSYTTHHQIAIPRNLDVNRIKQRFGNGRFEHDPLFAWQPWENVINQSDLTAINNKLMGKVSLNLFPNPKLTSLKSSIYLATKTVEDGFDVLKMDTGKVSIVYYDIPVDDANFKIGDTITLTADVFTDVATTTTNNPASADVTILCVDNSGANIAPTTSYSSTKVNEWQSLTASRVIPPLTKFVRIRFTHRNMGSVSKFRKVALTSNAYSAQFISASNPSESVLTSTVYVSKLGSNDNDGSESEPLLTIQKAVDALPDGGNVIVLDSADYRETLTINTDAHIKISATAGNRVNLFGSDKLVVAKTAGMNKVYKAPLATKPVGMGGNRGKPVIFEWGTPSKPIIETERNPLHRGLTHRLPYTEMFEAASKAELDTVNGKWFWEAGVIYFSATDGGDATLKRYEARARPVLTHTNGTIELVRVTSWFSNNDGMTFDGLHTKRVACMAYGAHANGFADNANFTESYKDISGGNGNDGFNATVKDFTTNPEVNDRLEQVYFDPYGHDNGDDGISDHYRSDCTIYGGYFEYNTKADVVHVTGSNSVCYNTQTRGTTNGFYAATSPTGDVSRVKTTMRCVNTKSYNNGYAYIASANSEITCDNAVAINPSLLGYFQTGNGAIYANDCKYIGEPLKQKSGNIVITNTEALTP